MANVTYTVQKGDTLTAIAAKYSTTVSKLVSLNNISNPNYIVVGQVLIVSGTAAAKKTNTSSRATIDVFGLQSNTTRSVYATWVWNRPNTDHYEVKWLYGTGDGVGFIGNKTDVEDKQSIYSAPDNATHVAFYVRPVSKTYKSNNRDVHYWTAGWSSVKRYYFSENPPSTPSAPTVSIKDYKLTATLTNLDVNADEIQFQIVKNDSSVFNTGTAKIKTKSASYSCTVTAGSEYKVRCRSLRDGMRSDWSEYSSNVGTSPAAPAAILELRALSETSIYMDWSKVANAKSYEIEYASNKSRFDSSTETQKMTVESVVSHAEVTGLESGEEWFFRVRAVNDQGSSAWTDIRSVKIGMVPSAPTTWSSTTTATTGDPLTLYWVHNSEDGSSQTYAELELIIDGVRKTYAIPNNADEGEEDKTSSYSVNTSGYSEGTKIQWRVRTRGIIETFGEWSVQRTIDVYAPPTLELRVTDSDGNLIDILDSFPINVAGLVGPTTQIPIGYHLSIISNEIYETVDNVGNTKIVNSGEEVYSKHFDFSGNLLVELSASNVDLENNVSYTVVCTVSMDSGLNAESSAKFTVSWTEEEYWPNAEISYDPTTYSTSIRPNCVDNGGSLVSDVTLSVYRREFNGEFVELATGLDNVSNTFITDPHPSLDFARYRVVATTNSTGKVSYYDVPGYPVGEKAIIIQWNEDWSSFDATSEDALEQPVWSGSLLRLPYNIDVSDSHDPDVEHVKYIGRKHPVSYYGTQRGETYVWNVEIDKKDTETIYALRRLSNWMGDVYVREPSGSGYWASITVSFSQKHVELTVPVTINITRVTGGV